MRIIYWTTCCLEPEIEAVSKEVFDLANNFEHSLVFAVSPHLLVRGSVSGRYVGVSSRLDPIVRPLIPLLEMRSDINHVYSEISPWIFYKTLKKKPTVLTIASEKGPPVMEFLETCRSIVVQTEEMRRRLLRVNVDQTKVCVVYPGIDLSHFARKAGSPDHRTPRVLFATVPRTEEELGPRGVRFMVQAAKHCPDMHLRLMMRPWKEGCSSLLATKDLIKQFGVNNIQITEGFEGGLDNIYQLHHFTVIPYTTPDGGKECPRSLIESLACGVPVLISEVAPFASFIAEHECGVVFPLTSRGFAIALEQGLSDYPRMSKNAVACAIRHFDRKETFKSYENIYRELM